MASSRAQARQMILLALISGQSAVAQAQEETLDSTTTQAAPDGTTLQTRRFRLFPAVDRKVSFTEIAFAGGRNFLDFIEYFFAIILPSLFLFIIVLGIFILLQRTVPELIVQMLARVGAPEHKQVAIQVGLSIALIVSGIYVALRSIGFDLFSLAIMFGVLAIVTQAAFADPIQNIASGIQLKYSGTIRPNREYTINGMRGTVVEMGHFSILFRLTETPTVTAVKSNHECSSSTVLQHASNSDLANRQNSDLDALKIE